MKDFKTLKVWQKSHELTLDLYKATRGFPTEELYGLTAQLRRSSASIPANIAEGCGRSSDKDMRRFLDIAAGSACETEYHLLLAHDLSLLDEDLYTSLNTSVTEIKKMLTGLRKTL